MKKRDFLKTGSILALGSIAAPILLESCKTNKVPVVAAEKIVQKPEKSTAAAAMYLLPALEYPFSALEPHIDAMTMEIHHGKHHAGYVNNLNKALEGHEWADKDLTEIFKLLDTNNKYSAIRNNAGGHYNHSLFWKTLGPNAGGSPQGKLLTEINNSFGSFEAFKNQFVEAAMKVFGSGWAWLSVAADKKLFISATPNQDNPLMKNLVAMSGTPLLGLDVWEHAYYLKYQNKRKDYLMAFFNVVRWDRVSAEYEMALK
jgi:superoxide dismutase, Fe-Mn family